MNCQQVEGRTFRDPKIREIFEQFVVADLYTDEDKKLEDLEFRLGKTVQLPLYLVIDPESERKLLTLDFENRFVSDPSTFGAELEKALAQFRLLKGN